MKSSPPSLTVFDFRLLSNFLLDSTFPLHTGSIIGWNPADTSDSMSDNFHQDETGMCQEPVSKVSHQWMCSSCHSVFTSNESSCSSCGETAWIPYLDRRPLLLSPALLSKVVALLEQAELEILDFEDVNSQYFYASEYIPFLEDMISQSDLARTYFEVGGSGYRETSLSDGEVLAMFAPDSMQVPHR